MQNGRAGRLHPAVGTARRHLAAALEKLLGAGSIKATGRSRTASTTDAADLPLVLVACSGGPDSLALAAIAAHFARRNDVRVGAIIVDHSLQRRLRRCCRADRADPHRPGTSPRYHRKVQVPVGNMGPEMAARTARYTAFTKAVEATGARAVLLGHTLDDQAETVLLGLSRGSGTRSLAGMPPVRVEGGVTYLRPSSACAAPTCSTSATLKPSPLDRPDQHRRNPHACPHPPQRAALPGGAPRRGRCPLPGAHRLRSWPRRRIPRRAGTGSLRAGAPIRRNRRARHRT